MPDPPPLPERCLPSSAGRRACLAQLALGAAALSGCGAHVPRRPEAARSSVVPFSSALDTDPPEGWAPYVLRRDRVPTVYSMSERDGRRALHARGRSSSTALQCEVAIEPQARPWLSWSWCADRLIAGARVDEDSCDDAVARLVLAFDGDLARLSLRDHLFFEQVQLFTGKTLPYASLLYVWDSVLPVGTVVHYPRSSRIKYLVVESGPRQLGHWIEYRRNVIEDHQRAFGEPPGRVTSVGCFTDCDDLKAEAQAWYGDIAFGA